MQSWTLKALAQDSMYSIAEFTTIAAIIIIVFLAIDKNTRELKQPIKVLVAMLIGIMGYTISKIIIITLLGPADVAPW